MRISESKANNGPIPEERTSSNKQTDTTPTPISVLLTRGELSAALPPLPPVSARCRLLHGPPVLIAAAWPRSPMPRPPWRAWSLPSDRGGQASFVESYSGLWLEMSVAHPLSLWMTSVIPRCIPLCLFNCKCRSREATGCIGLGFRSAGVKKQVT